MKTAFRITLVVGTIFSVPTLLGSQEQAGQEQAVQEQPARGGDTKSESANATTANATTDAQSAERVHEELRALREAMTSAVTKRDYEEQLKYAARDIVVTWQNGQVVRGHEQLKSFFNQEQGAIGAKMFRGYKEPPTPTEKTILYGDDTGISYGTSVASYNIFGKELDLKNHWSATLVKQDGKWLISNYHVSTNVLDNPLLQGATTALYLVASLGLAAGFGVGWLLGRRR